MPCFCTGPAEHVRNYYDWGITPLLPTLPLSLKLAAALPALDPANRLDMQIAAMFEPARLPRLDFGGGAAFQLAATFNLMVGSFKLDDLPMFEMQMQQAAASIESNVWPRLGYLTTLKLQPLINYALVARLVLDLQDFGLDPFEMASEPPVPFSHSFSFSPALSRPHLEMVKILGGLPALAMLGETLSLPPLGSPDSYSGLGNFFGKMADLRPPHLSIPLPMLTKLALVLESLATINEAFGQGFSPAKVRRVQLMLQNWSHFNIPLPLEALRLNAMLQTLPALEDFRLGERMAGSSSFAAPSFHFSPPRLAIAPFLNVMLALQGSLQFAIDMPAFDMCGLCPFA
ncbi:hypothetical protein [Roseibium sp.]|uniref:hypothetical protein n=1 Tax=Roseibium sp. TaxID=1936156 RepID=UPI003A980726